MNDTFYLDGIFGSGMVLQRNTETKLWGRCPNGAEAAAALDGVSCPVECSGGRFTVTLPARPASEGHVITLTCGGETLTLDDVCFGEVFLLSGQSNMQLPCARVIDRSIDELKAADNRLIRHFTVEPRYSFSGPLDNIPRAEWKKAVYPDVLEFSAAGYFFAADMYKALGVPIGLVLNAMGGARIEAWMSESSVKKFYDCSDEIDRYKTDGECARVVAQGERRAEQWYAALAQADRDMPTDRIPEDAVPFEVPGRSFGTELDGHTGSVYFYKEITLENEPAGEALLYAGNIFESDTAYINGVKVGETGYRYPPRRYTVPEGVLRKERNLIAERVVSTGGAFGFVSDHPYFLSSGEEKLPIDGTWYMKKGSGAQPLEPALFPPLLAVGLYNASLMPLKGIRFAGLLWYQGESNSGTLDQTARYDEKFAELMRDWREQLAQPLPVVCVEMCDFDDPAVEHQDKVGWLNIQRQQREAPGKVPCCAVALAHDLAEPWELHPQRKKELGERLAAAMLKLAYL